MQSMIILAIWINGHFGEMMNELLVTFQDRGWSCQVKQKNQTPHYILINRETTRGLKKLFTKCFLLSAGEEERNMFLSFTWVSVMPRVNELCPYYKHINEQSATNRLPSLKCENTWQSWGKNCCYSCRWVLHTKQLWCQPVKSIIKAAKLNGSHPEANPIHNRSVS